VQPPSAGSLELQALTRPVRRAGHLADHRLLLDGKALGEVMKTGRGYLAFDESHAAWVGPFKRLSDLARVFTEPAGGRAAEARPVIAIPTTKGRVFWSMHVELTKKEK
jgi:hypothetical protein